MLRQEGRVTCFKLHTPPLLLVKGGTGRSVFCLLMTLGTMSCLFGVHTTDRGQQQIGSDYATTTTSVCARG